jgi:hypothetical protein
MEIADFYLRFCRMNLQCYNVLTKHQNRSVYDQA